MAEFERGPFLLVFALDQALGALLTECFDGAPLAPADFGVTSALRLAEPIRPTALAEILGMRPTTLSNYIRRLADRGLVRRDTDPVDGRAALLRLTPEGRSATEACFPGFSRAEAAFGQALAVAGLTPEQARDQLAAIASAVGLAAGLLEGAGRSGSATRHTRGPGAEISAREVTKTDGAQRPARSGRGRARRLQPAQDGADEQQHRR